MAACAAPGCGSRRYTRHPEWRRESFSRCLPRFVRLHDCPCLRCSSAEGSHSWRSAHILLRAREFVKGMRRACRLLPCRLRFVCRIGRPMTAIGRSGTIQTGNFRSLFWGLSFLITFTCLALAAQAPLEIPLTIQEAIYADAPTKGIARDQGPVTVGIPLADSAAIKDVSQVGLKGASAGQFRVLGR